MKPPHTDAELAARQLSLVTALVAGGTPPAGVDSERIRIQALAWSTSDPGPWHGTAPHLRLA